MQKEMQQHTYGIMDEVEGSHWWFVGRRAILETFLRQIIEKLGNKDLRILDVGCGTGANLEMLSVAHRNLKMWSSAHTFAYCLFQEQLKAMILMSLHLLNNHRLEVGGFETAD